RKAHIADARYAPPDTFRRADRRPGGKLRYRMGRLMQFSANLGFLYRDLALPDAIRAAKRQGFAAVELHWPYDIDPAAATEGRAATGLPLPGVTRPRGNPDGGDFGRSALPGRETEARAAIDEAVAWAVATGCRNIHVMAGKAKGDEAFATFVRNLQYAAETA